MKDDEGNPKPEPEESPKETERSDHKEEPKKHGDEVIHLQWRDWIALSIASLETVLLPAVAIAIVLAVLILAFRIF